jgi:CRP-like cAMP-binding protein
MSRLLKYYGIKVKKGATIFKEGDDAHELFMIHKGKVEIRKGAGALDKTIQVLGEGQFIGEMALINEMPRSATAIALEDCELIHMDRAAFQKIIKKNNDFSVSVVELLSNRLRETDELVSLIAKRERSLMLMNDLLKAMLFTGKKDKSGRWCLVNRSDFISHMIKNYGWSINTAGSELNQLVLEHSIRMKRDPNGAEWLAYELTD